MARFQALFIINSHNSLDQKSTTKLQKLDQHLLAFRVAILRHWVFVPLQQQNNTPISLTFINFIL